MQEIAILRGLRHPRILKLFEVYEGHEYVHLILEYLKGGELFDRIQAKGGFSEADAARIMSRLLEVVAFCHNKGVIHRDLKPENIILTQASNAYHVRDTDSDLNFKIVDFGLATQIEASKDLTLVCGSPGYVAPEILRHEGYNLKADVFSCGVILYALYTREAKA